LGAELVEFSPISDPHLPSGARGLYLGGGYPELHASALAANRGMREEIAAFARSGRPVIAECGGFMYLTEAIVNLDGQAFPMVALYPTRACMQQRLAAIGYTEIEPYPGLRVRGHEFRYSTVDPAVEPVLRRTMASYVHLHWLSCPEFAARFVADCEATV
jgi:cobyrinic acid a,c-diamide synthase